MSSKTLRFGVDECCGKYFKGHIDEVIIYDYALDTKAIRKYGSRDVSVERVGKLTARWALLKKASTGDNHEQKEYFADENL